MGFNTAMIVRNDFLHDIKEDPKFGEKVWTAVCYEGNEEHMPYVGQSFSVLPSSHADYMQVIAVGGNRIRRLGFGGNYRSTDEEILKGLAASMGYNLVKKPGRRIPSPTTGAS